MEASNLNTDKEKEFPWRIKLGTILGFPLFIHVSFFLWFIGLFWVERTQLFLFISLLVLSVCLHELAHALMCHWLGLGRGTLTVWFLGGYFLPFSQVSLFDMNRSQRFRYILMVFAGPLSNVLLSFFFISLAYITSMDAFYVAARYNLTLAMLNLLPVGMLDGGRILTYLASTIVNWRKAVFITGILCLVLAASVFIALFSDHWISRYSNWTGFLLSMGFVTIKESRKSEDEIRTEAQNQVSKEIAFVEEANRSDTWLLSVILAVAMVSMLIYSVWYLSYYYILYRDLPGQIVYVDYDNNRNGNLYITSGLGFPVVKVSRNINNQASVSSSQDGSKIIFGCTSSQNPEKINMCITDYQGSAMKEVSVDDELESLYILSSPSGNMLAFSSRFNEVEGIWVVDVITEEIKQLSDDGAMGAWSPDENYMLIVRRTDNESSIVSIDLRDGSEKNLINMRVHCFSPVFSQDGRSIYFGTYGDGETRLHRMDSDGSNRIEIPLADPIYERSRFSISPDNLKIAFECGEMGDLVCVANLDGSQSKQIAEGEAPVWSPDSKYIAYSSTYKTKGVFVIRPDGTMPFRIKPLNEWGSSLIWLP